MVLTSLVFAAFHTLGLDPERLLQAAAVVLPQLFLVGWSWRGSRFEPAGSDQRSSSTPASICWRLWCSCSPASNWTKLDDPDLLPHRFHRSLGASRAVAAPRAMISATTASSRFSYFSRIGPARGNASAAAALKGPIPCSRTFHQLWDRRRGVSTLNSSNRLEMPGLASQS